MTQYATYDTTTGRIIRSGTCQPEDLAFQAKQGQSVVELDDSSKNDANSFISGGVVVPRPSNPATISGLTISNIPTGCVLTIEGTAYIVNDGTAELSFNAPGTYSVGASLWPYLPKAFEVPVT
jgi:hypothetical protein